MPQNTELPLFKAGYPIYAPAQKSGGITVSTALGTHAVPNKPTYAAGSIQMVGVEGEKEGVTEEAAEDPEEESSEEEDEEEEDEEEEDEE